MWISIKLKKLNNVYQSHSEKSWVLCSIFFEKGNFFVYDNQTEFLDDEYIVFKSHCSSDHIISPRPLLFIFTLNQGENIKWLINHANAQTKLVPYEDSEWLDLILGKISKMSHLLE